MTAGDIRNELKDNNGISNPQVVAWDRRKEYYAAGEHAADLPTIDGYDPVTDPSIDSY